MSDPNALTEAVLQGDQVAAAEITRRLLERGHQPGQLLDKMTAAMDTVGERFQCKEMFVPDMLVAARAMSRAMAELEPVLTAAGIQPNHHAVIGTVAGDLHDIGKNLVAMMWKGAGFEVVDLGTNVPPEAFISAVEEHYPDVVGLSALLTTTMPAMQKTIEALQVVRQQHFKVVVGGAPVTSAYAEQIGADGYAPDAAEAVKLVRGLVPAT